MEQAIASGLTDLDLVFIEEAFERLLLDYDRSSQSILELQIHTADFYPGEQEYSVQWASPPVYGEGLAKSTKATKNLLHSVRPSLTLMISADVPSYAKSAYR
jgi:hypothetical protein